MNPALLINVYGIHLTCRFLRADSDESLLMLMNLTYICLVLPRSASIRS